MGMASINYLQRIGKSSCIRCEFETNEKMSFAEQDAAMMAHLVEKHPDWMTEPLTRQQEQRLAEKRLTPDQRRIIELEQQLADERLAFDHANEVIGKLEADIAALSWTRITLENLPKMGDMVLIFDGDYCVDNVLQPFANGKKNQLKGWKNIGASHRRPINPPTPPGEEAVKP